MFKELKNNYDLSKLNIIAVADKKFENIKQPQFDEEIGYNVISPLFMHTLNPSILLLTVKAGDYVEKCIYEEVFSQTKKLLKCVCFLQD